MTTAPDTDGTDGQRTGQAASGGTRGLDRRSFLKAASVGAGGVALGTSLVGSASANIDTPKLAVSGNTFVDPEGNPVTLRGVNVVDPRRADTLAPARGKNAVQMVDAVTQGDWETQVVRVPLQPSDILERTSGYCGGPVTPGAFDGSDLETYLADHVDAVVDRCQQNGVYCILDYHRHWTNDSSDGSNDAFDGYYAEDDQGPIDEDLQNEVVTFWDVVAERYGDRDHTLFEVYNEPTEPGVWENPLEEDWAAEVWFTYVDFVQPAVDRIDAHTDNPLLLGSPSWTQCPEGILVEEEHLEEYTLDAYNQIDEPTNLAMTYHIYPGHEISNTGDWDEGHSQQGVHYVYEEYPLVVTEFGWDGSLQDQYLSGSSSGFGDAFVGWMEDGIARDAISWTAWNADIWWDPTMFETAFEETDVEICDPYSDTIPQDCPDLPCEWTLLTGDDHMGDTIRDALAQYADHNNPQVESGDNWDTGTPDPTTPTPTLEGSTETPAECDPAGVAGDPVAGANPQDLDGDGDYMDVNANCRLDSDDVVTYFEEMDAAGVQNNVARYDYNGNERIDFDDVVTLFESL